MATSASGSPGSSLRAAQARSLPPSHTSDGSSPLLSSRVLLGAALSIAAAGAGLLLWSRLRASRQRADYLHRVYDQLQPSPAQLLRVFDEFKSEMRAGLESDGASMKMIPTYVDRVPTGREAGDYYALDLGGTNFRVLHVRLDGRGGMQLQRASKFQIPEGIMSSSADVLFGFIAECVDDFVRHADAPAAGSPAPGERLMGFTFSFPVRQTGLASGTLIAWTKGFSAVGVVGEDVVQLLHRALQKRGVDMRVAVLANDTVGTWATAAYGDTSCVAGVILGTGSNAAYVERLGNIKKWPGSAAAAPGQAMVVNMEWGNFDSARRRALPFTKWDDQLDAASLNPGAQRYEKMLSGMYLGELARLVLLDLLNHRVLLPGHRDEPWKGTFSQGALHTADLSQIEADASPELEATRAVLERLHVYASTLDDRRVVRRVCHLVVRRAACLAATGIAAIVSHLGKAGGCGVAVDGSVYELYPGFHAMMQEALAWVLGDDFAANVRLTLSKDGSGLGAALLAAIAAQPAPSS